MKTTGINLIVLAACVLWLSSAKAAVIWDSGSGITAYTSAGSATASPGTGAASISGLTFSYNGNHAGDLNGGIVTISITAGTGYDLSGLTANYTVGTWTALTGITVTGSGTGTSSTSVQNLTTASHSGGSTSLKNLSAGNTLTFQYALSSAAGGNNGALSFGDISISATTITVVPEPVNYALAGFGLVFFVGGIGRFYLARRRYITAG